MYSFVMKNMVSLTQAAEKLGVNPQTLRRWHASGKFQPSFVSPGGHRYYSLSDLEQFMNPLFMQAQIWAHANKEEASPLPDSVYCPDRSVFQYRLDRLAKGLEASLFSDLGALLVAVIGEIGNNSFDHNLGNWLDEPGIYFSSDIQKGTVVLADRGQGILATLKRVRPSLETHLEALRVALMEVISGRAPEPRGNGLKFVRAVVLERGLNVSLQSGDARWSCVNGQETIETIATTIPGVLVSLQVDL